MFRRIEADINLDAIRHNIQAVQAVNEAGKNTLLVIKADAYGHGAVEVAKKMGDLADYFGVACIDEALELRNAGICKPILILGYTDETAFDALIENNVTAAVYDYEKCKLLSERALALGKKAKVHIKADSGMSRIGFQCDEKGIEEASRLLRLQGLDVEGVFTHYAKADEKDKTASKQQYEKFLYFTKSLEANGFAFKLKHIDNSAGAMELHSAGFNMMRLGIVIYGLYPSDEVEKSIELIPAMALRSRIIHIKTLEAGRGISYGWTYSTKEATRVATVSAGYADGYPRSQSGLGHVLVRGKKAPILGRVCMDQLMIDVSHIPEAKLRDAVTLIGSDGEERISVEEVASPANSFNYELVCNISRRVPRVYFENGQETEEVNDLLS